jgi:hypothetical protein
MDKIKDDLNLHRRRFFGAAARAMAAAELGVIGAEEAQAGETGGAKPSAIGSEGNRSFAALTVSPLFQLDGSSAALTPGDWVAPLPSDPTKVTRATPTSALAAGAILGCVDAAYSPGGTNVVVRRVGDVVAASVFSDLSTGAVSELQLTASGRAARRTMLFRGAIRCGTVDAKGNVTVDPYVPPTCCGHFSPATYGAAGDGVTDDLDWLNAMLAAMPADSINPHSSNSAGYIIEWEPGMMCYVRDQWVINKGVRFHAHGGNHSRFTGGIISAAGKNGSVRPNARKCRGRGSLIP